MDNNYIDEIVRDSIGEYEMAFSPDDWDAMESRLENDARVRRKLYTVKAVEACLMLVTIWTILQFVQIDNTANYEPQLIEKSTTAPPVNENERTFPLDAQDNKENRPLLTPKTVAPADRNTISSEGVPMASHFANPSTDAKMDKEDKNHTAYKYEIMEHQLAEKPNVLDYSKLLHSIHAAPIASLTPKNIEVSNNISLMPLDATMSQTSRRKHKMNNYMLGGFTGTDFVSISTSDNYALQKDASSHLNVSAGIVLDRKFRNKIRIETGAILASRKHTEIAYDAFAAVEKIGTYHTTSIEIPANALYEILENDKNTLYAVAGISNHFAMSVLNREMAFDRTTVNPSNAPVDPAIERFDVSGLLYDDSEEIFKNHYASANIGGGYERKIGNRLSLFAQATLKKGFGKFGEHDDNITAVSLSAGVKTML
jgi:hypothetical protein